MLGFGSLYRSTSSSIVLSVLSLALSLAYCPDLKQHIGTLSLLGVSRLAISSLG